MTKDGKAKDGSSPVIIAIAAVLGVGAVGLVYTFQDQASQAEKLLLQSKEDYREMQQKMKKPVEEYVRQQKGRPTAKEEPSGDLLTFLDRKARDSQIPPGVFTIARNATSVTGNWQESSYTVTLQSDKKETAIKRSPLVDFLGKVERERRLTKTKSIQLTFAGDDLKSAIIGFSQFQPK
jgi:hypothetical protein